MLILRAPIPDLSLCPSRCARRSTGHDGEISGRIDELLTRSPGVARYQPLADGNVIDIASARELRASLRAAADPNLAREVV